MPTKLFEWDVVKIVDGTPQLGACGVTTSRWRAIAMLNAALQAVPAEAKVWGRVAHVELNVLRPADGYHRLGIVAYAGRGPGGVIVWVTDELANMPGVLRRILVGWVTRG